MSPMRQILTIAGLELRRVFFSRRSLWVYLLALLPAVIFVGHAVEVQWKKKNWGANRIVSPQILDSIHAGFTDEAVVRLAGPPSSDRSFKPRQRRNRDAGEPKQPEVRRQMTYFDGARRLELLFEDGQMVRRNSRDLVNFEEDRLIYTAVFQYFYLRLAVFFGCLGIFINLFRGEMLDRSLHFWFLAPVKREVLLLGKYCAGLTAAALIFGAGAVLSFLAMVFPQDPAATQAFWQSVGVGHLASYTAAAMLGCVGYGAVFVAAGLLMKNPITPAVTLLFWESINGFLPQVLQKLSVLHHLQSLCPVAPPMDAQAAAVVKMFLSPAPPSSPLVSVLGLLGVTALVLLLASRAVRRLEINYGTE